MALEASIDQQGMANCTVCLRVDTVRWVCSPLNVTNQICWWHSKHVSRVFCASVKRFVTQLPFHSFTSRFWLIGMIFTGSFRYFTVVYVASEIKIYHSPSSLVPYVRSWAQWGGDTGNASHHFLRQWGYNMPGPPTFFSLRYRNILVSHQAVSLTFYNQIVLTCETYIRHATWAFMFACHRNFTKKFSVLLNGTSVSLFGFIAKAFTIFRKLRWPSFRRFFMVL